MRIARRMFGWIAALVLLSLHTASFAQEVLPYQNPALSPEERAADLLARMSLEEKIGQMTLVEKNSLRPADVTTYFIGGVLSGGGGYPSNGNNVEAWAEMVNAYQSGALATPLAIPVIYGVDAVHGHGNLRGSVIFPHNIGLGATRNPELIEQIARITAQEMIATGIYWNYAPVLAVPQDIRWGRTYEGYGENTDLVTELSLAYLRGLQGESLAAPGSVLGTPKHYVGDGGAVWGTSPFGASNIDRGITDVDEETLRRIHLPPYLAAIDAGAMSIMASFTSWGGLHMHAQEYLLTDVLKGELGFSGFIVSDWQGIDLVHPDYYTAIVTGINAGIDMNMVPQDYRRFIDTMHQAVENGDISLERIDDAVERILRVKFAMGLFEHPFSDPSLVDTVGSEAHREVARQAVRESLVLLRNDNDALPITADDSVIFVAGDAANDIGIQSGGWTIEWQGRSGSITEGTSILEALTTTAESAGAQVFFNRHARYERAVDASGNPLRANVGIMVMGEMPYAEWEGDDADLALADSDLAALARLREVSDTVVVVLLSGRPLVITEALLQSDAFVAAWLPGTEGQGVVDVLFGTHPFTGRLPYTWLRSIDQLPFDFDALPTEGCDAPLFPYGYGLTYENGGDSTWIELALTCAGE